MNNYNKCTTSDNHPLSSNKCTISDENPLNSGGINTEVINTEVINNGSTNNGSTNRGSINNGSTNNGSTNRGSINNGSTNRGSINRGSINTGSIIGGLNRGGLNRGSINTGSIIGGLNRGSNNNSNNNNSSNNNSSNNNSSNNNSSNNNSDNNNSYNNTGGLNTDNTNTSDLNRGSINPNNPIDMAKEHKATLQAICNELDKDSDLYKCLIKTKNTKEIEQCFEKYSIARNATVIGISPQEELNEISEESDMLVKVPSKTIKKPIVKPSGKSGLTDLDEICDDDGVYYKSDMKTYERIQKNPIDGLYKVSKPSCPPTKMKHDGNEYIIDSHPDIGRWGHPNPTCADSYIPDHEAQKFGMLPDSVRCKNINDFNIKKHKDILKYVPVKKYNKLKNSYEKCEIAFNGNKCSNNSKSLLENSLDLIDDLTSNEMSEESFFDYDKDKYEQYNIANHKQFQNLLKNYVPVNELEQKCKDEYGLSNEARKLLEKCESKGVAPIENHPDISKYVLKTSIPAPKRCKTLNEYPIVGHKDIVNYVHKESIPAPKEIGDYEITQHPDINKFVLKSSIPAPKRCNTIGEYTLYEHPEFADFKKGMEDKYNDELKKYSSTDKCGNLVKCKTLDEQDITKHKDFKNYVAKKNIEKCENPNPKDITQHPDYDKLIKKLGVKIDKCGKPEVCKNPNPADITQHPDYQKVLTQLGVEKDKCGKPQPKEKCKSLGEYDIKNHPDYQGVLDKLGVEKDKCGKPKPCDNNIENNETFMKLKDNYNKILNENSNLKSELSKKGDDGCALNFIDPSTGNPNSYESFSNYENVNDKDVHETFSNNSSLENFSIFQSFKSMLGYGSNNNSGDDVQNVNNGKIQERQNSKWDIRNHKDFKNIMKDYITKEQCYSEFNIEKDKCGKPKPCENKEIKCKKLADYNIEDHPDYKNVLMKFGARKTKCGKLIPAPKCPCIVKDKCGKYKYKPCPKPKKCPVCKPVIDDKKMCEVRKHQTELIKSKIKLDIMIKKYKNLVENQGSVEKRFIDNQKKMIDREIKNKKELEVLRQKSLNEAAKVHDNEVAKLKENFDKEVLRMKKELKEKDEKIQRQKKELTNKSNELKKKQNDLNSNDILNKKLEKEKVTIKKALVSEYNNKINNIQSENDNINNKCNKLVEQNRKIQEDNNNLKLKLSNVQSALNNAKMDSKIQTKTSNELGEDYLDLDSNYINLEKKNNKLNKQMEHSKDRASEVYYSQHIQSNNYGSSTPKNEYRRPEANAQNDGGWSYNSKNNGWSHSSPTHNEMTDGINKFYMPSGVNYRFV